MEDAVLVTGAGGFVGSAVVRRLVVGGSASFWDGRPVGRVVALLRPGGSAERLSELRPSAAWSLARCDLADPESVAGLMSRIRPRAVLHLGLDRAAFQHVLPAHSDPLVSRPLEALFAGLGRVSDARFVHTGSAWVLRSGEHLAEDAPLELSSPYTRNKARADALLPVLGEHSGVPWINLRLFNAFGRHELPGRLLPHLVARLARGETALLSHGDQVRDFSDVDAMAEAYVLALRAPAEACDAVYHVGSGRGCTVRAFAHTVAEVVGNRELIRFGVAETEDRRVPALVADPTLARERLGWTPDVDLRSRIHKAASWWLDRWGLEPERPTSQPTTAAGAPSG
jgi:nucleoside-diphosphate-sugar epimerase